MICPVLECNNTDNVTIEITTPITSYPYIKITLDVLNSFGIVIQEDINENQITKYTFVCNQNYRPQSYSIPGDFSSAAFLIAGAVLSRENSQIVIHNLDISNPQGDKHIINNITPPVIINLFIITLPAISPMIFLFIYFCL